MIKPDGWIREHAHALGVNPEFINPASVDVCLGGKILEYLADGSVLTHDLRPGESFLFKRGCFYLAHSQEFTCIPNDVCAQLILKSSSGRKGLDHSHSGWGDPGFCGEWTFEFVTHRDVFFTIGQRIAQLVFMGVDGTVEQPYGSTDASHYQGQRGVTQART